MLIKKFEDGSILEYGQGKFDGWCVYYNGTPPLDLHYFKTIVALGMRYDNQKVYNDFIKLYDITRSEKILTDIGHKSIESISIEYPRNKLGVEVLFTILYAAMVAEEQKANTRLGCKIKRLGVHQILMDEPPMSIEEAVNYSKGMSWRQISHQCNVRGF